MKTRWLKWLSLAALLSCGWSINHRDNPVSNEKIVVAPETIADAFDRCMKIPAVDLIAEYQRLATNTSDESTITPDGPITPRQLAVMLAVLVRADELERAAK